MKSGVTKAHRYEPDLNPTYQDMAAHYGIAIVPTRARKPRDKAKVEGGVLIVERWILAALRHHQHFSLGQLNTTIRELLERLNNRPFRKLPGCRREQFEQLDKPVLQPLPAEPYVYAEWKKARVHIDYHVAIDGKGTFYTGAEQGAYFLAEGQREWARLAARGLVAVAAGGKQRGQATRMRISR